MTLKIAKRSTEIVQCQYLIASIYNRHYDIVFSTDITDLNAKIEPYPHRYIMGMVDGQLAACCGLYVDKTYVVDYGKVSKDNIDQILIEANCLDRYRHWKLRELTKLVIAEKWKGTGIAQFFLAACHNAQFLSADADGPWLLTTCATVSIFNNLHERIGIHTRPIKPFPYYRVHEQYRSEDNPMESRLIIPELDIPPEWLEMGLPGTHEVVRFRR